MGPGFESLCVHHPSSLYATARFYPLSLALQRDCFTPAFCGVFFLMNGCFFKLPRLARCRFAIHPFFVKEGDVQFRPFRPEYKFMIIFLNYLFDIPYMTRLHVMLYQHKTTHPNCQYVIPTILNFLNIHHVLYHTRIYYRVNYHQPL